MLFAANTLRFTVNWHFSPSQNTVLVCDSATVMKQRGGWPLPHPENSGHSATSRNGVGPPIGVTSHVPCVWSHCIQDTILRNSTLPPPWWPHAPFRGRTACSSKWSSPSDIRQNHILLCLSTRQISKKDDCLASNWWMVCLRSSKIQGFSCHLSLWTPFNILGLILISHRCKLGVTLSNRLHWCKTHI